MIDPFKLQSNPVGSNDDHMKIENTKKYFYVFFIIVLFYVMIYEATVILYTLSNLSCSRSRKDQLDGWCLHKPITGYPQSQSNSE